MVSKYNTICNHPIILSLKVVLVDMHKVILNGPKDAKKYTISLSTYLSIYNRLRLIQQQMDDIINTVIRSYKSYTIIGLKQQRTYYHESYHQVCERMNEHRIKSHKSLTVQAIFKQRRLRHKKRKRMSMKRTTRSLKGIVKKNVTLRKRGSRMQHLRIENNTIQIPSKKWKSFISIITTYEHIFGSQLLYFIQTYR